MQDRLTYANGNTITTEGFRCSVGEPIDIKVTVGEDEEVDLQGEAGKIITYGDYLITLEVNGEKAAYRDLYHLGDPVTIGDYTISDDMYLDGVSEGDEVVMRLEPVELMVTDAFRAAVKSLGGSESSGGGSGGGVTVVNASIDRADGSPKLLMDKTWKEISEADFAVVAFPSELGSELGFGLAKRIVTNIEPGYETAEESVPYIVTTNDFTFSANTEDSYPTAQLGAPSI